MARVLLVDDEPVVRNCLEQFLKYGGYEVLAVEGGAQAFLVLGNRDPFSLVITDFEMPAMNGPDLIKIIREAHFKMPIIMVTARPDAVPEKHGADVVLEKPIGLVAFLKAVDEVLKSKD